MCYNSSDYERKEYGMAKKGKKKNPYSGLIRFGILYFLFSNFTKVFSFASFLLVGGLALLVAFVIGVMASGLDTSKNQKRSPRQVELAEKEEKEATQRAQEEERARKAAAQQAKAKKGTGDPQADSVLDSAADILSRIQAQKPKIDDPDFLSAIAELEGHIKAMMKNVFNQPSDAPLMRKFISYYLPTTLKMIEKYAEYESLGYESIAVKENKRKIIDAVKVVNEACHKQIDLMVKDDILDINTDINTLEHMLKRDGLVESEFEKIRQETQKNPSPVTESNIENMDADIQSLERALKQDGLVETEWEKIQKMNQGQTQADF